MPLALRQRQGEAAMVESIGLGSVAELRIGDRVVDLPLIDGNENEAAIDISRLREQTGLVALDEGYRNTGSARSAITFIAARRQRRGRLDSGRTRRFYSGECHRSKAARFR
jgi:hypothetical protein